MKNYLITGGAGFIGSNTAEEILKRGDKVKIIDDLSTGRKENIEPFLKKSPDKIEFIKGSICNLKLLQKEFQGVDYVLHLAAAVSVPYSVENPLKTNEVNVNGTLNVLLASRDNGVKRVVFASSSAVYGDSPQLPKTEDITPAPLSPYAVSKITGEYYMKVFYQLYGLETVSLRYFNIFGPKQNPDSQYASVIPKFIKLMSAGKRPTIFGDGSQTRDFTHVRNVVRVNLSACEAEKAAGKTINIGCGEEIGILELVEGINKILGRDIKPKFADPKPGDIKHSQADISRAKDILGYSPQYGFREGLEKTISQR